MIAFVRGKVAQVFSDHVVIDVGGASGGIGLAVQCAPSTVATLRSGESAQLMTSLVVREDGWTLFGFADDDERTVFELVQTVSGIGPRIAQAMLATMRPDDIRRAVASDDLVTLTKVPGIGRKGAQRIVLELKDRIGSPSGSARPAQVSPEPWKAAVLGGLVSLGWSARDAALAVDAVADQAGDPPDVPVLLKAALATLAASP